MAWVRLRFTPPNEQAIVSMGRKQADLMECGDKGHIKQEMGEP